MAAVPSEKNSACVQVCTTKRSLVSGAAMEPLVSVGACSIGDIW